MPFMCRLTLYTEPKTIFERHSRLSTLNSVAIDEGIRLHIHFFFVHVFYSDTA